MMAVGQYDNKKMHSSHTPTSIVSNDQTSLGDDKVVATPFKKGNARYGILDDIRYEPELEYATYFSVVSEIGDKGGFYD